MQTPWQDLRFSVRQLGKGPGFAVTTVVTLALGIGATSAIFSLVDAVLLRPLAFPEFGRLVWLAQADHEPGVPANAVEALSYPNFFDWRQQNHSFNGIASYRNNSSHAYRQWAGAAPQRGHGFPGVPSGCSACARSWAAICWPMTKSRASTSPC